MSEITTLCYIEREGQYLMLHRIKKKGDINAGKWIGLGGHVKHWESPDDCVLREVKEECGLRLTSFRIRGIVTFCQEGRSAEYMFLYTADGFEGEQTECEEGELAWVKKEQVCGLPLWEGDRIFLDLLQKETGFFSLKLCYRKDVLVGAVLDGKEIEVEGQRKKL